MKTNLLNRGIPRPAWVRTSSAVAAAILLGVAAAQVGCVGRQEAIQLNNAVRQSADDLKSTAEELKKVDAIYVKSLAGWREYGRKAYQSGWEARAKAGQSDMTLAHLRSLSGLDEEYARQLDALSSARKAIVKQAEQTIENEMKPQEDEEKLRKSLNQQAQRNAAANPQDVDLQLKHEVTWREYLSVATQSRDLELRVRKRVAEEVDKIYDGNISDLEKSWRSERTKVGEVYQRHLAAAAALTAGELALGPEPKVNAEAYNALIEYASHLKQASDAMNNYIVSNSLGQGSFVADLFKSFGGGLVSGIFKPGEAPSWQTVADNGKDILGDLKSQVDQALKNAADSGKAALQSSAADILKRANDKVSSLVKDIVKSETAPKPSEAANP